MIVLCSHCHSQLELPGDFADDNACCSRCGEVVPVPPQSLATLAFKAAPTKPAVGHLSGFLEPAP